MYKYKEVNKNVKTIFSSMFDVSVFDIYFTEFGTALTTILPILFLCLNTVTVTAKPPALITVQRFRLSLKQYL